LLQQRFSLASFLRDLLKRTTVLWAELARILIPLIIVVEFLKLSGLVEWLGRVLGPVMGLLGLPGEAGVIWAMTLLTNLYGGMVVFGQVVGQTPFTVAEATTLTSMMLIAHALPVEVALCKRVGVSAIFTTILRVGSAFVFGILIHQLSAVYAFGQEEALLLWKPEAISPGIASWLLSQGEQFLGIWIIILILLLILELFRVIGLIRLIEMLLLPVLLPLRLSKEATPILITGLTLGITYGGALLIEEADKGSLKERDITLSVGFLCVCHSLFEDTLLMMLLGGALWGILFGRFLFAFLVTLVLSLIIAPKEQVSAP
jgi:hypothetical protein